MSSDLKVLVLAFAMLLYTKEYDRLPEKCQGVLGKLVKGGGVSNTSFECSYLRLLISFPSSIKLLDHDYVKV